MANASELTNISLPACNYDRSYGAGQTVLRVYLIMPLCLVGIMCNCINVHVFLQRSMRRAMVNWFLCALAASDGLLLCSTFWMLPAPALAESTSNLDLVELASKATRWFYPTGLTVQTFSVYTTVALSVYRYLGVCQPFWAQRRVTATGVMVALVLLACFAVCYNGTTWFEVSLRHCHSALYKATATEVTASDFMTGVYFTVYKVYMFVGVMFVAPFAVLICVNLAIVNALMQSRNLRQSMGNQSVKKSVSRAGSLRRAETQLAVGATTKYPPPSAPSTPRTRSQGRSNWKRARYGNNDAANQGTRDVARCASTGALVPPAGGAQNAHAQQQQKHERSVTMMLLAVVCLFLLCNTIPFINNVLEMAAKHNKGLESMLHSGQMFTVLVEIGNLLVTFNASATAIVYGTFSSKYRQIFMVTFSPILCVCLPPSRQPSYRQRDMLGTTLPAGGATTGMHTRAKLSMNHSCCESAQVTVRSRSAFAPLQMHVSRDGTLSALVEKGGAAERAEQQQHLLTPATVHARQPARCDTQCSMKGADMPNGVSSEAELRRVSVGRTRSYSMSDREGQQQQQLAATAGHSPAQSHSADGSRRTAASPHSQRDSAPASNGMAPIVKLSEMDVVDDSVLGYVNSASMLEDIQLNDPQFV